MNKGKNISMGKNVIVQIGIGIVTLLLIGSIWYYSEKQSMDNQGEERKNESILKDSQERDISKEYEEITEQGVCPDDVKMCSSGGLGEGKGEPDYPLEIRRVPPECEFPACPG